jgi:hypothetical protein
LDAANAEITLEWCRSVGKALVLGVGTSTLDIISRIYLMVANKSPICDGTGTFVGGISYRWTPPGDYIYIGGTDLWPASADHEAYPLVAGDVQARVTTMSEIASILAGKFQEDAGWEMYRWGSAVAVVWMDKSWLGQGEANLIWALAHMEYPFAHIAWQSTIYDASGQLIGNNMSVPNTSRMRIPGPISKILFVSSGYSADTGTVRLGVNGGAGIASIGALNSIIGGVSVNVGLRFNEILSAGVSWNKRLSEVLSRWRNTMGNEVDEKNAFTFVSNAYAAYYCAPRRWASTSEGHFVCDANIAPSVDTYNFRKNTVGLDKDAALLSTLADASMPFSIDDVRAGHTTHSMEAHNPFHMLAICSRMFLYSQRSKEKFTSPAEFGALAATRSVQLCLGYDYLNQMYSVSEEVVLNIGNIPVEHNGRALKQIADKKYFKAVEVSQGTRLAYKTTYNANDVVNTSYANFFAVSANMVNLTRICEVWAMLFADVPWTARADTTELHKLGKFRAVNLAGGSYVNMIQNYGVETFHKNPEIANIIRRFNWHCGTLIDTPSGLSALALAHANGAREVDVAVSFSPWAAGAAKWVSVSGNFGSPYKQPDRQEMTHPALPQSIDVEAGMQKFFWAIEGEKALFYGPGEYKPCVVDRNKFAKMRLPVLRDSYSVDTSQLSKFMSFRD